MADLSHYRLKAIGPATALAGVEDDSVQFSHGATPVQITGQSLAAQLILNRTHVPEITYTDKTTMHAPTFAAVSNFGIHWVAQDSAGGDGSGILSAIASGFTIPQSVSADKSGEASTAVRVIMSAAPTIGTTTKTLTAATTMYEIGPTEVAGSTVANIESQSLQFGLNIWTNAGQTGSLYATELLILRYSPVITITTTDLALVDNYLTPATVTSNACLLKFKKIDSPTSGYTYTIGKARIAGSIKGGFPGMGTLTITPIDTAGAAPISGAAYTP